MENKRKAIPKKIRFEVFKRDSFTCQYCGKKAPEIVLEVDHIDPVANGGTGDIMNLITACEGCNAGKSDKLLSDNTVIEKQQEQLEKLQERREQLDMLMQWKESLLELSDYETEKLIEFINNRISPHSLVTNKAKIIIMGWKKKFGFDIVLDAIEISASQYLVFSPEGHLTEESTKKMLEKIPGICYNEKKIQARSRST